MYYSPLFFPYIISKFKEQYFVVFTNSQFGFNTRSGTFLSLIYINHFCLLKSNIVKGTGGFKGGIEGKESTRLN